MSYIAPPNYNKNNNKRKRPNNYPPSKGFDDVIQIMAIPVPGGGWCHCSEALGFSDFEKNDKKLVHARMFKKIFELSFGFALSI